MLSVVLAALYLLIGDSLARVLDGDTLELCSPSMSSCEAVRLANINAPKSGARASCPVAEEGGLEAFAAAAWIVAGSSSIAVVERLGAAGDRTLGLVTVVYQGEEQDFGALMVRSGRASPRDHQADDDPDWCPAGS
jgi:endonuclease YncB( thermonuclease family)